MSQTSILPFELGTKVAHATTDYSALMGEEFTVTLSDGNEGVVRLCRLDNASGVASPAKLVMVGTTQAGAPDHEVTPCTLTTERAYGVCTTDQEALDDNDYFFVIVQGLATVIKGDNTTATAVGQRMGCDDDADEGKVLSLASTALSTLDVGTSLTVTSGGTDADVVVMIEPKLLG